MSDAQADENDSFSPYDVGRVLSEVVEPIVQALIAPEELEGLLVTWELPSWAADIAYFDRSNELSVVLTAEGEHFVQTLWAPGWPTPTPRRLGEHLADMLEDWISETRFGWGQRRVVPVELLEALPGPGRGDDD